MCGISGILRFDGSPPDRAAVRRMTARLTHRGPDDEGFLFDGPLGLGHRRLRIIDREAGAQPIADESKRFWVALNGEIYNFRELRRGLEPGHRFRTRTDTEVLVHLYEERGDEFVEDLNGMFALALWDSRERTLLLARDRLGIKPLYVAVRPGGFLFASEIKSLFASGLLAPEIDRDALYAYLRLKYVPGPATIFRGVERLPPATIRKIGSGRDRTRRYWSLPEGVERRGGPSEAAEEIAALLEDAVRMRLVADVPVGLLLSGGIDSTSLLAVLHRRNGPGTRTFTVGFPQFGRFDEAAPARRAAERFGAVHRELEAERADLPDLLFRLAWQVDEPISDPAILPTYLLCRRARREVTVALSGEGADELFGGYNKYRKDRWLSLYRRLPGPLRAAASAWMARLGARSRRWDRIRGRAGMPDGPGRAADWSALFGAGEIASLTGGTFGGRDEERLQEDLCGRAGPPGADPAGAALRLDLQTSLVDSLLMKVDKASMANSMEVRVPFLDHRLVERAVTLPFAWKVRRGETKWILKRAMRDLLPDEVLRRPKHGFDVPVSAWLRSELRDTARDCLQRGSVAERLFFRRGALAGMLRRHLDGSEDRGEQLWGLLVLEVWLRTFIEPAASDAPRRPEAAAVAEGS